MLTGVVGPHNGVTNDSRIVHEIMSNLRGILSTAEQVEFCGKQPRPLGKAKYYSVTDSEQVP
jgi:hypothetical protein